MVKRKATRLWVAFLCKKKSERELVFKNGNEKKLSKKWKNYDIFSKTLAEEWDCDYNKPCVWLSI